MIEINKQEIKVKSEQLLGKVKELVKEGNVRRISIKNKDGNVIIDYLNLD